MRNSAPPNPPPGQVPGDEDPHKVMKEAKVGILDAGVRKAMARLCRWKAIFAMWQVGTRPADDGEFRAITDAREMELIGYVERRALIGALLAKGIIKQAEWANALIIEAQAMEKYLEKRFPGFRASDTGIEIASNVAETTKKHYGFPE